MLADDGRGADGWPVRMEVLPRWVLVAVPAAAVVIVLVVAGAAWLVSRGEAQPASPGEVVAEFFHAQRAGDCERLIAVVATKSWSADGRRSRAEFLDQCDEVLGGDAPARMHDVLLPDEIRIIVEGDEAEVTLGSFDDYMSKHGLDRDYDLGGTLVRQDGGWKVEAGEGLLRIGPSAWGTVRAYFEAYANRECGRLADYVSTDAGQALQARCEEGSEDPLESAVLGAVTVAFDGDAKATVTFGGAPVGPATLVKEGLSWKVASFPLLPDDLQTKLLDEVTVNGQPCFEWHHVVDDDVAAPFGDIEPDASVRRDFSDGQRRFDGLTCDFTLRLHAFSSEGEAQAAAGSRGSHATHAFVAHGSLVVEVELTQDDHLDEYGSSDAPAIAAAQVDGL